MSVVSEGGGCELSTSYVGGWGNGGMPTSYGRGGGNEFPSHGQTLLQTLYSPHNVSVHVGVSNDTAALEKQKEMCWDWTPQQADTLTFFKPKEYYFPEEGTGYAYGREPGVLPAELAWRYHYKEDFVTRYLRMGHEQCEIVVPDDARGPGWWMEKNHSNGTWMVNGSDEVRQNASLFFANRSGMYQVLQPDFYAHCVNFTGNDRSHRLMNLALGAAGPPSNDSNASNRTDPCEILTMNGTVYQQLVALLEDEDDADMNGTSSKAGVNGTAGENDTSNMSLPNHTFIPINISNDSFLIPIDAGPSGPPPLPKACWIDSPDNRTLAFTLEDDGYALSACEPRYGCVCDAVCHLPQYNDCCINCWPTEWPEGCHWQEAVTSKFDLCEPEKETGAAPIVGAPDLVVSNGEPTATNKQNPPTPAYHDPTTVAVTTTTPPRYCREPNAPNLPGRTPRGPDLPGLETLPEYDVVLRNIFSDDCNNRLCVSVVETLFTIKECEKDGFPVYGRNEAICWEWEPHHGTIKKDRIRLRAPYKCYQDCWKENVVRPRRYKPCAFDHLLLAGSNVTSGMGGGGTGQLYFMENATANPAEDPEEEFCFSDSATIPQIRFEYTPLGEIPRLTHGFDQCAVYEAWESELFQREEPMLVWNVSNGSNFTNISNGSELMALMDIAPGADELDGKANATNNSNISLGPWGRKFTILDDSNLTVCWVHGVEKLFPLPPVLPDAPGIPMGVENTSMDVLDWKGSAGSFHASGGGFRPKTAVNFTQNRTTVVDFYGNLKCNQELKRCYCDELCHTERYFDCCLYCWPPEQIQTCDWRPRIEARFNSCSSDLPPGLTHGIDLNGVKEHANSTWDFVGQTSHLDGEGVIVTQLAALSLENATRQVVESFSEIPCWRSTIPGPDWGFAATGYDASPSFDYVRGDYPEPVGNFPQSKMFTPKTLYNGSVYNYPARMGQNINYPQAVELGGEFTRPVSERYPESGLLIDNVWSNEYCAPRRFCVKHLENLYNIKPCSTYEKFGNPFSLCWDYANDVRDFGFGDGRRVDLEVVEFVYPDPPPRPNATALNSSNLSAALVTAQRMLSDEEVSDETDEELGTRIERIERLLSHTSSFAVRPARDFIFAKTTSTGVKRGYYPLPTTTAGHKLVRRPWDTIVLRTPSHCEMHCWKNDIIRGFHECGEQARFDSRIFSQSHLRPISSTFTHLSL